MGKTIAQDLMEKGRKEGRQAGRIAGKKEGKKEGELRARQQTLLRQLGKRFGALPAETVAAVESATNIKQLDTWLDRVLTAVTLEEVGIG